MTRAEKDRARQEIAEAFDFVRFLVKNPRLLRKVKDGSEILFLRAPAAPASVRVPRRVQAFAAETVYHAVSRP